MCPLEVFDMKKMIALGGLAVATAIVLAGSNSGLDKGERVVPFRPNHIMGPLANTTNCFPCTFQNRPQVQVWVNGESNDNIKSFAKTLDTAMGKYKTKEFKAMVVVVTKQGTEEAKMKEIGSLLKPLNLKNVDVSIIGTGNEAVGEYKINTGTDVKNTIFAYRNWMVKDKWVNAKADAKGLTALNTAIDQLVK